MVTKMIKRGEVYYANLDPVVGHKTGKRRPVLVIQNDIGNQYSPTTIVAVVTAYSRKKASFPICVTVKKESGLTKDSIVNLSQIRTIDKKRILEPKLADLTEATMTEIDQAILNSLGIRLKSI